MSKSLWDRYNELLESDSVSLEELFNYFDSSVLEDFYDFLVSERE